MEGDSEITTIANFNLTNLYGLKSIGNLHRTLSTKKQLRYHSTL